MVAGCNCPVMYISHAYIKWLELKIIYFVSLLLLFDFYYFAFLLRFRQVPVWFGVLHTPHLLIVDATFCHNIDIAQMKQAFLRVH